MRKSPEKAMILAAGLGTRLKPYTDSIPKCMVRIAGKPLLEHTLGQLRRFGVRQAVINLCHLPEAIRSYFGDGSDFGLDISYSFEPVLLGTAGGLKAAGQFFSDAFFVWYGDNLSTCRLDRLWEFHCRKRAAVTIALIRRDDPRQSGIVGVDSDQRVRRFLEKPRSHEIFSHLVSAGIFVLEPEVLRAIPGGSACDFGRDVFPALLAEDWPLFGYEMCVDERLWWVDTPRDLSRVKLEWEGKQRT